MGHSRRLTEAERRQIVRERTKGVSVSAISAALKVSPKTVYNVLSRGRSAVSANNSRTRVLTIRVSERDLRGFDGALARRGITHRSDAMRCLMLAADIRADYPAFGARSSTQRIGLIGIASSTYSLALYARPPVRLARPSVARPRGLEHCHLLDATGQVELWPRPRREPRQTLRHV